MSHRTLSVGDHVIFTDEHRRQHNALLTEVWGTWDHPDSPPAVNLLYVVDEESRNDQYGRQIERESSVVHRKFNSAGGNCWHMPDEP